MIDKQTRATVFHLYQNGMAIREISKRFTVNRNTVKTIIAQKGKVPERVRKDKINVDDKLLGVLYAECDGYVQRMHEILTEEKNVKISYPTLVRRVAETGLSSTPKDDRSDQREDIAGEEMQHDTSDYKLMVGDKKIKVIASVIYFRYCKMKYLKFYRHFNRFNMKCFFHEALMHFGYSAKNCIIDNTNLARHRGTGRNAIISPEMENFSAQYGFKFICHEIMHSNRKAGNERSFYTVETNFFPGRSFKSFSDLNKQAYDWATKRMPNRRQGKTRVIPNLAFEYEKPFLNRLISEIPAPYKYEFRLTDQYGYISYKGHYYWIPGTKRYKVTVFEYSKHIEIFYNRKFLIKYTLPEDETKNQIFRPKDNPQAKNQPKYRKKSTEAEEKKLRSISEDVDEYINFMSLEKGVKKHRFIRYLYELSKKVSDDIFIKTIKRSFKYKITEKQTIEKICIYIVNGEDYQIPFADTNKELLKNKSYLEGQYSDEVDLTIYDDLLEGDDDG